MNLVTLGEIIDTYQPGPGRHWFDSDTLQFFRCRLPEHGIRAADDSVYFVSSERPPYCERRYTVRRLAGPGKIETVGTFCGYPSRSAAVREARRLAA